jgi:hypothetical protein
MTDTSDLLTKEEIAAMLNEAEPLSVRSVERYIELAKVTPAVKGKGRGSHSKFTREDAEKIRAAYQAAAEGRDKQSQALTTTKPASLQSVALSHLIDSQSEGFKSLSDALDSWPTWLTKAQALERTGLPVTWFDAGVKKGAEGLPHVGEGRARRFHRDDVRAFAERVRGAEYLKDLLSKKAR